MDGKIVFPIEEVQLLRDKVGEILHGEEGEIGYIEDRPYGWSKSNLDPNLLVGIFSSLRVKESFILRAYVRQLGTGGYGIVWAMPETSDFPDPNECVMSPRPKLGFIAPKYPERQFPRPPRALDYVMDVIEGDGTHWSYLSASIFAREMAEFGAWWHGQEWSTHIVIGDDPWTDNAYSILPDSSRNLDERNSVHLLFNSLCRCPFLRENIPLKAHDNRLNGNRSF
jgi:hypothetical protein